MNQKCITNKSLCKSFFVPVIFIYIYIVYVLYNTTLARNTHSSRLLTFYNFTIDLVWTSCLSYNIYSERNYLNPINRDRGWQVSATLRPIVREFPRTSTTETDPLCTVHNTGQHDLRLTCVGRSQWFDDDDPAVENENNKY